MAIGAVTAVVIAINPKLEGIGRTRIHLSWHKYALCFVFQSILKKMHVEWRLEDYCKW